MSKIVGILGFINSGKGTVASHLVDRFGFRQDSFASSLKDAVSAIFDWPRNLLEGDTKESREWRELVDPWWSEKLNIENFSPRLAMQLIGTDSLRTHFNKDIWFLTIQNRLRKNSEKNVVISDVRFPNEIRFIRDNGGYLIRVNRGSLPVWYETAIMANNGNSLAYDVMTKTYSSAHLSEWAWVGSKTDAEVDNNGSIETLKSQLDIIINKII